MYYSGAENTARRSILRRGKAYIRWWGPPGALGHPPWFAAAIAASLSIYQGSRTGLLDLRYFLRHVVHPGTPPPPAGHLAPALDGDTIPGLLWGKPLCSAPQLHRCILFLYVGPRCLAKGGPSSWNPLPHPRPNSCLVRRRCSQSIGRLIEELIPVPSSLPKYCSRTARTPCGRRFRQRIDRCRPNGVGVNRIPPRQLPA